MSLEQWRALGEDTSQRSELQEGVLIVSPRPRFLHQRLLTRLAAELIAQAPTEFVVAAEPEVVLTATDRPTVRNPAIVVARDREDLVALTADDVVLVIEIVSPGTRHVVLVRKRGEYADAGIPHYWIVDLDDHPRIELLTLSDGRYVGDWHTGTVEVTTPFTAALDLDALV
ncbi:Uma2 family endonuclease [Gordonia phthalatica]|nr:Uma2 family endonuclease [Gordonia phthalatica]